MLLLRFPIYVIAGPPYCTNDLGLERLNAQSKVERVGDKNKEYIVVYTEEVFAISKLSSRQDFVGAKIFEINSKPELAELLDCVTYVHSIAGLAVDLMAEEPAGLIPYSRLRAIMHAQEC